LYKRYGDDSKPYEHPHTHAQALEKELDSTRERYKKQITELTNQVEKLTGELAKLRKQQDSELHEKVLRV
jgi:chaperonin cofactor prefoldin